MLVVAMTLIAILGASFVSFMGSKQKGFLYQIDSYKALNIANAGVEYAIRTVYDNIASPEAYIAQCDSLTVQNFADGQFKFCYQSDYTNSEFNTLRVEGIYDGGSSTHTAIAARTVKLTHFMNYASKNSLSGIPYNLPGSYSSITNSIMIPIINAYGNDISINRVDLSLSGSSSNLRYIYFTDDLSGVPTRYYSCTCAPSPCTCSSPFTLTGPYLITANNMPRWCILAFDSTPPTGIVFFYSSGVVLGSLAF